MLLIKVNANGTTREEVKRLVDIFRGRIIDVTETMYTIELTGTSDKLDAFVQSVRGAGIVEVVRSGVSGIARGEKNLRV
jgi:acetolactate synthase-1/3 small subunit